MQRIQQKTKIVENHMKELQVDIVEVQRSIKNNQVIIGFLLNDDMYEYCLKEINNISYKVKSRVDDFDLLSYLNSFFRQLNYKLYSEDYIEDQPTLFDNELLKPVEVPTKPHITTESDETTQGYVDIDIKENTAPSTVEIEISTIPDVAIEEHCLICGETGVELDINKECLSCSTSNETDSLFGETIQVTF